MASVQVKSIRRPRRSFFRTVRGGSVTIGGVTYRPNETHLPYDGRLDGMRFLFHRYVTGWDVERFIALWGTERAAKSDDPEMDWPGPECVNGNFVWIFWDAVEEVT